MSLREQAIILAAENYSNACSRLTAYVSGAPTEASNRWSKEFREGMDEKMRELENAKERLLRLAQKL